MLEEFTLYLLVWGACMHGRSLQACLTLLNPWTVAQQATLSIELYRKEYLSGLPFPTPGDRPNTGIEPKSPTLRADSLPTELSLTYPPTN